jgi:hypothetical protein
MLMYLVRTGRKFMDVDVEEPSATNDVCKFFWTCASLMKSPNYSQIWGDGSTEWSLIFVGSFEWLDDEDIKLGDKPFLKKQKWAMYVHMHICTIVFPTKVTWHPQWQL